MEYKEIKSLHCDQNERFEPFLFFLYFFLHMINVGDVGPDN